MVPYDGEQAVTPDMQEQARLIMETRARELGVTNVAVRPEEPDLLIVELRGEANASEDIRRTLSQNGFLEIVDGGDEPLMEGVLIVTSEGAPTFEEGKPQSLKEYQAIVTSREIVADQVTLEADQTTGQPIVTLGFNEDGERKMADYTTANAGKYMGVVMDKRVLSSPRIQAPIAEGASSITGLAEPVARRMVAIVKAGMLPTKLELIETQQLGTSTNP
jgi:preprotein translocase subunit SecD